MNNTTWPINSTPPCGYTTWPINGTLRDPMQQRLYGYTLTYLPTFRKPTEIFQATRRKLFGNALNNDHSNSEYQTNM
jgi:hypothetical protein